MGRFEIKFSRKAAKQYKKLPKEYKNLVDIVLFRLSGGLELDLKPVEGEKDVYRIRVGRYRVLFIRFNKTVLVFRISPRGDVYKG
ncbi:MAG: type II toxin-antitoxin system RelE/ParE family toxin [Dehalococcoidia bacterium]